MDPVLFNLKGKMDLTAGKTPSNNVYTPMPLGLYELHGVSLGPDSELDSIFIRDANRFSVEPLLVSVGQPYAGYLEPGAVWWPAKSGMWPAVASQGGPRFDIIGYRNGLNGAGSAHSRAPYNQPVSSANIATAACWVSGRKRIRIWIVNPSTTDPLTIVFDLFGMAEANRKPGGTESIGIKWKQTVIVPAGDGATSGNPIELPFQPGTPTSGIDLITIESVTNTNSGANVTTASILIQGED